MIAAREDILREADLWAVKLRRAGYTQVEVAPDYCIGNAIDGGFFTRTVCVSIGPRMPPAVGFVERLKAWWNA